MLVKLVSWGLRPGMHGSCEYIPPRWTSGKASVSWAADLSSIPAFVADLFPGWVIPVIYMVLQWLLCQPPGVTGSALGLVARCQCSTLWLGKRESLIYNFCLSVTAQRIVWADPALRYTWTLCNQQTTTFCVISVLWHIVPLKSLSKPHCSSKISVQGTLFQWNICPRHIVPVKYPSKAHCSSEISVQGTFVQVQIHTFPVI